MDSKSQIISLPGDFEISYRARLTGDLPPIVFIHGFGSSKDHFRFAYDPEKFSGHPLLTMDLVGFGDSCGPADFDFAMASQAHVINQVIDHFAILDFHLCAHSMGGLIAMNLAEIAPERILSLVDMEGNLTKEDCFISGRVTEHSPEDFAKSGKDKLTGVFKIAGRRDPSLMEYAETFAGSSTEALYRSAQHTISGSTDPLIERLMRINNFCYIYGEKNKGEFPGEELLLQAGARVFYIENAGHSMATENPEQLFEVISAFIHE